MDPIEEFINNFLAEQKESQVTKAELDSMLEEKLAGAAAQMAAQMQAQMETAIAKAMPPVDREGVGRKGVVETPEDLRERDPAAYIVEKARHPETLTAEDKVLTWGIMESVLRHGMKD